VEVPDLVDHLWVAGCGAARVPPEERQHEILRRVEGEQGVCSLEVALLGLRRPLSVLDGYAPLTAPWARDVYSVLEVSTGGCFLVDLVLPEDEGEGQDQPGRRLVERRQLVAEAVLDVIRVYAVIHDLERPVETGWHGSRVWVRDHQPSPFVGRERFQDGVELLRVFLEARESLLARQLAEVLGVVAQCRVHHLQSGRVRISALLGLVPILHIALEDVDHVTDQVTRLPLGAARLYLPVLRVGNHSNEVRTVTSHNAHDRVLAFGRHRVDRRDHSCAQSIIPLPEAKLRPRSKRLASMPGASRRRGRYDDGR